MGWFDNLENDLNDDQPGPSGLCNVGTRTGDTIVEELNKAQKIPQSQTGDEPGPSGLSNVGTSSTVAAEVPHGQSDENAEPDANAKPPTPFQLFVEKVTIAGLREAFEEIVLPIKYMYRIAIFLFSIMIIYQSIKIANQYTNESSILDTLNVINERAPFPNISVCYPMFFNSSEILSVSALTLSTNKRANAIGKYHNFTETDYVNSIRRVVNMDASVADLRTPLYLFARAIHDQIVQTYNEKGRDAWLDMGIPECASVISECKINGQPFDCCSVAIPMSIGFSVCYQIDVSKLISHNISHASDVTLVEMRVSTDWEYSVFDNDNSASDGYHIFINSVPFQGLVPESVPAVMDGSIVLAEPQKLSQVKDCLPNENAQHLKYFDYYDSQGILCMLEAANDAIQRLFGCHVQSASYFPFNQSCTYAQLSFASLMLSTATSVNDAKLLMSPNFKNEGSMEKMMNIGMQEKDHFAAMVARRSSSCRPLCSRWEYPVLSVSYAKIEYSDTDAENQQNNVSWSRLRIILPYSSSIDRQERKIFSASYMAMGEIGGMMGVYLGFSMITIVQLLVYGGYSMTSIDFRGIWTKIHSNVLLLWIMSCDLILYFYEKLNRQQSQPSGSSPDQVEMSDFFSPQGVGADSKKRLCRRPSICM